MRRTVTMATKKTKKTPRLATRKGLTSEESTEVSNDLNTGSEDEFGLGKSPSTGSFHDFHPEKDIPLIQEEVLRWYDRVKRDLPWRTQNQAKDLNGMKNNGTDTGDSERAYAVWVSEIMLQQTQVATVIDYYNRWMKKWPTLQDLAGAKLEEVNEMWTGLGYYSRGRRLHEGAQKVVEKLGGVMPRTAEDLQKELPGVGRYTAGAIASIAFGEKTGVVDGNVIRVLSRLRMIGADSTSPATMEKFWGLANGLAAQCDRPGDLNQSLMELGATVCTPKTPKCSGCPASNFCKAYQKTAADKLKEKHRLGINKTENQQVPDIECLADSCKWCLPSDEPWDPSLGVMNFPRKAKKKASREQTAQVTVVCRACSSKQRQFLVFQRPQKGLLAGLWEFPSADVESKSDSSSPTKTNIISHLRDKHNVEVAEVDSKTYLGEVVHIFSHINQTYQVTMVTVTEGNVAVKSEQPSRWLTEEELGEAAIPTAMKKVFKLCKASLEGKKPTQNSSKRKREPSAEDQRKQRSIASFFAPKR